MLARRHLQLHRAHQESDLVAPDGMPLVWTARLAGFGDTTRVCGPDLLLKSLSARTSLRLATLFLWGSARSCREGGSGADDKVSEFDDRWNPIASVYAVQLTRRMRRFARRFGHTCRFCLGRPWDAEARDLDAASIVASCGGVNLS